MEKLGFHEEGLRRGLEHINGAWLDHLCYALTAEEVPDGLMTMAQRLAGLEVSHRSTWTIRNARRSTGRATGQVRNRHRPCSRSKWIRRFAGRTQ